MVTNLTNPNPLLLMTQKSTASVVPVVAG